MVFLSTKFYISDEQVAFSPQVSKGISDFTSWSNTRAGSQTPASLSVTVKLFVGY